MKGNKDEVRFLIGAWRENKRREEMDRERWGLVEQRIWIGDHSTE